MSKRGHAPIRMCMGCRKRRDKRELIRMTRNEAGALIRCETGELRGRGFYVCPDAKCLTMTQKKQGRKTPSSIVK